MFSKRGELRPGHLYQSPFCLPRPWIARNLREQQRGKTRANRQESLPGPRPSWTWHSLHLLDPPQLTKPIHSHPPRGLTWSLHCQNLGVGQHTWGRTPKATPSRPWLPTLAPGVSVDTALLLGDKATAFHAGPPGRLDSHAGQGTTEEDTRGVCIWPGGAT